jgi:hypothetical protein
MGAREQGQTSAGLPHANPRLALRAVVIDPQEGCRTHGPVLIELIREGIFMIFFIKGSIRGLAIAMAGIILAAG